MLIRSIRAINFMRFSKLEISNLPAEGIIGIEGPNESGKTSLGEALLFAFFGRTRLSLEMGVDRLIRWEADQLSVEVEFELGDGQALTIYRELDRSGTNYVKLIESKTKNEVATGNLKVTEYLQKSIKYSYEEALDSFYLHQLDHVGGIKPRGGFLHRMTGVEQIEASKLECEEEITALEREFAQFHKDLGRNQSQISHIEENQSRLPQLNESLEEAQSKIDSSHSEQGTLKSTITRFKALQKSLDEDAKSLKGMTKVSLKELEAQVTPIFEKYEDLEKSDGEVGAFTKKYQKEITQQKNRLGEFKEFSREVNTIQSDLENLQDDYKKQVDREADGKGALLDELNNAKERLNRNKSSCRVASFFATCSLLLSTVFGALVAVLLLDLPGNESVKEQLRSIEIDMGKGTGIIGLIAGICLVFFLTFLARRISLGGKGSPIRKEIKDIDAQIEVVIVDRERVRELLTKLNDSKLDDFLEQASQLQAAHWGSRIEEFQQRHQRFSSSKPKKGYKKCLENLSQGERGLKSKVQEAIQSLETQVKDLGQAEKKGRSDRDRVQNEIREIEAQQQKLEELNQIAAEYRANAEAIEKKIEAQRLAISLLTETARSTLSVVGPALTKYVRNTLPKLTNERYRDVKLDEDLAVTLFTSEKCDFLQMNELSGGTLEGLELAIRLASSQAFIQLRAPQAQFVFLDEPFKMMDSTRSIDAMKALKSLSPDLKQYFLTRPDFTSEQRDFFDVSVRLKANTSEIVVDCSRNSSDAQPEVADYSSAKQGSETVQVEEPSDPNQLNSNSSEDEVLSSEVLSDEPQSTTKTSAESA